MKLAAMKLAARKLAAKKLAAKKLAAMALASAVALSGTCAFAHTVRHKSEVGTRPTYSDAAPSVFSQPKYGNPDGGTGNRDVWGHWGAYYGPMIPTGAGGR
jgi:hypothetical protein